MDYRIISFMVISLVGVTIYLQVALAKKNMKSLLYEGRYDMNLVSPGEIITFHSKLSNLGRIPIMYVNKFEDYPLEVRIEEDDAWKKKHLTESISGKNTKYRLFMMPHTTLETSFHLSLPSRGIYELGKYYIETGDFLGLYTKVNADNLNYKIVVIPDYCSDEIVLETIGGFMGEISVRRFILEDPVLNLGFRDYTGNEPMKDISWMQTARAGKLQVKLHDYTVDMNVAIIFNMDTRNGDETEKCFTILRTVCEELENHHFPYEVYSNGDIGYLSEGLGKYHLNSIMERAGKSEMICYKSFESLVEECKKNNKNHKSFIVITPPLDADSEKKMNELKAYSNHEICVLVGSGNTNE